MADKNILKLYDKGKNIMTPGVADMPEGMKKRIYSVGEVESLNTDYKGDLVGAVNEINDKLSSTGSSIPGPQNIKVGDMDEGYFGVVTGEELITGDELAKILGITQGVSQNSDTPWHKFGYKGKTLFISQKTIRHSVSWDHLNEKGVVYGDKIIEIGGVKYRVRLVKGALTDPSKHLEKDLGAMGSEWNRLMAPLSIQIKDNSWSYPACMESDLQDWGTYLSDSELAVRDVEGRRAWCQEAGGDDSTKRVYRGGFGVSHSDVYTSYSMSSIFGWRPVLEVVPSIGNPEDLRTKDKTSLVGAVNEINDNSWGKDELVVGGRNLISGTSNDIITLNNNTPAYGMYGYTGVTVKGGEKYTLSGYITKGSYTETALYILIRSPSADSTYSIGRGKFIDNEDLIYTTISIVIPQENDGWELGYQIRNKDGATGKENILKYQGLKLEKGNIATDWTPAPEDVQSEIDNLKQSGVESNKVLVDKLNSLGITASTSSNIKDNIDRLKDIAFALPTLKTKKSNYQLGSGPHEWTIPDECKVVIGLSIWNSDGDPYSIGIFLKINGKFELVYKNHQHITITGNKYSNNNDTKALHSRSVIGLY